MMSRISITIGMLPKRKTTNKKYNTPKAKCFWGIAVYGMTTKKLC